MIYSQTLKCLALFVELVQGAGATVWNFNLKFYRLIYGNISHLTAKWNMIMLKNDEIMGFWKFWTWPPTDFSALKMFKLKLLFNFQKTVTTLLPMTSQWRFDIQ